MTTTTRTDGDRVRALLKFQGRSSRWLGGQIGLNETQLSKALAGDPARELTTAQKTAISRRLDVVIWMIFADGRDG
jgi:hypothetical protein